MLDIGEDTTDACCGTCMMEGTKDRRGAWLSQCGAPPTREKPETPSRSGSGQNFAFKTFSDAGRCSTLAQPRQHV